MRFSAQLDDNGALRAEIDVRPAEAELNQARRDRLLAEARRAGLPEFRREDLQFTKFSVIHKDGERFKIVRGEISDPGMAWCPAVAFVDDGDGSVIWLERLP